MHKRLNKEKLLFAASILALVAASIGFLYQRAWSLIETAPRAIENLPRSPRLDAPRALAGADPRDPRHSPFMPEHSRPVDRRAEEQRAGPVAPIEIPNPEKPGPVDPPVVPGPDMANFGYVGVASAAARACALIRTPAGQTIRVEKGETLCDSNLTVARIEKQYVVLTDSSGRSYLLTRDGLR